MKRVALVRSLAGLVVFSLGLVTGLVAQTVANDSPQRVEQKRTDLSGAPGESAIRGL